MQLGEGSGDEGVGMRSKDVVPDASSSCAAERFFGKKYKLYSTQRTCSHQRITLWRAKQVYALAPVLEVYPQGVTGATRDDCVETDRMARRKPM